MSPSRSDGSILGSIARRLIAALLLVATTVPVGAQTLPGTATPPETPAPAEPAIAATTDVTSDVDIARRIRSIFAEIAALRGVQVRVSAGVVTLTGTVPAPDDVARAATIAGRVAGVVTVQNDVERDLKVERNLTPVLDKFTSDLTGVVRALPLIGVALALAGLIGYLGHLLAGFDRLWRRISPNAFLAELLATLIRVAFIMLGIVAGLEVLGATALLGAVLGGAGVIGIAIGFAVRDTVDNYVSSLMLSLRQPFRANDHVVIEGNEGRVVRLTSRATILMTLDGNHLRIPNSTVFKAVILNYTRNSERRFDFDLGVDADDDPIAAMATGLRAIRALAFVIDEPKATAVIREVGDSNIVLRFFGWLDQADTDFLKGRSLALEAAKRALEESGFALPEPIYRLRFDEAAPLPVKGMADASATRPKAKKPDRIAEGIGEDSSPDAHVARLVDEERAETTGDDLLDSRRPIE